MDVKGEQQLIASVQPSTATNKGVSWTSSKSSVATVTSSGLVKAVSPGTAIITVKTNEGGKTATCTITVNPIVVTGVKVSPTSATLDIGETKQLTATVSPSNATNKTVTWTSSKTSVATVSSSGKVTAKSAGTAVITVKTNDGGKTAKCTITVNPIPVSSVSVSPVGAVLDVGGTKQLTATVLPTNATNKAVIWTSSSNSVATVNADGLVTAVGEGEAIITATTVDGNKTAICSIVVNPSTIIQKNVRIIYDPTCTLSTTEITNTFYAATAKFQEKFNVQFNIIYTLRSELLNGAECPNTEINEMCTDECCAVSTHNHDVPSCNICHHKGASRLLDILASETDYTCRLVGHYICRDDGNGHANVYGRGRVGGRDSIVTLCENNRVPTIIQHELSHNLGANHDTCRKLNCVLVGYLDEWCDNCKSAINENL